MVLLFFFLFICEILSPVCPPKISFKKFSIDTQLFTQYKYRLCGQITKHPEYKHIITLPVSRLDIFHIFSFSYRFSVHLFSGSCRIRKEIEVTIRQYNSFRTMSFRAFPTLHSRIACRATSAKGRKQSSIVRLLLSARAITKFFVKLIAVDGVPRLSNAPNST